MHKIPLTQLEEDGLRNHRLPIGKPSQLSDCFRSGMAWALSQITYAVEFKVDTEPRQATAQAEPVAQPEPKPLRRGTTGTCSRSICICDRDGLGDQCIWLRPSEPMIDGYPLMSGLPPPAHPQQATAQAEPVKFDHGIGADRYQVVKGSFWWHVRIGDSTANVGKFHTKMAAEDMALKLLTAFRDGAYLQSKAAQPQQATDARTCEHGCNGCEECTDDEGEA